MDNRISELITTQTGLLKRVQSLFQESDDLNDNNFKTIIESHLKSKGYIILTLLLQVNRQVKLKMCDLLIEEAITGTEATIGRAREVLCSIGYVASLETSVVEIVNELLIKHNQETNYQYYYYRNVSQLYYELNYKGALKQFIERFCKGSEDHDIREIYDDYK